MNTAVGLIIAEQVDPAQEHPASGRVLPDRGQQAVPVELH